MPYFYWALWLKEMLLETLTHSINNLRTYRMSAYQNCRWHYEK